MKAADTRTLKAIANIQYQTEFEIFMDWLRDSRSALIESIPMAEGERTIKQQGQLLDLNEIVNTVDNATDTLRKIHDGNT